MMPSDLADGDYNHHIGAPQEQLSLDSLALQPPHYMPIFNDMFKSDLAPGGGRGPFSTAPAHVSSPLSSPMMDLSGSFGGGVMTEEEDQGEGDYIDHLQQPGNTKKRKVPSAHHHQSLHGSPDTHSILNGDSDEGLDRPAVAHGDADGDTTSSSLGVPALGVPKLRLRVTAATLAGLQYKELLKTRKRQLAAVLGATSHGDTLALDQALVASYPGVPGTKVITPKPSEYGLLRPVVRARRRKRSDNKENIVPGTMTTGFPLDKFTFECHSASELNTL